MGEEVVDIRQVLPGAVVQPEAVPLGAVGDPEGLGALPQPGADPVRGGELRAYLRQQDPALPLRSQRVHPAEGRAGAQLRAARRRRVEEGPPRPRGDHLAPVPGPAPRDRPVRHPLRGHVRPGLVRPLQHRPLQRVPVRHRGLQEVAGGPQNQRVRVVREPQAPHRELVPVGQAVQRAVVPTASEQGGPVGVAHGPPRGLPASGDPVRGG
mmetsp:Transcript_90751/g.207653  ORF Transcript_90751/g.207653 Transcript_90751/m.207653 type:complete len:210 (-) Transcript_90751:2668-3297(-)